MMVEFWCGNSSVNSTEVKKSSAKAPEPQNSGVKAPEL